MPKPPQLTSQCERAAVLHQLPLDVCGPHTVIWLQGWSVDPLVNLYHYSPV